MPQPRRSRYDMTRLNDLRGGGFLPSPKPTTMQAKPYTCEPSAQPIHQDPKDLKTTPKAYVHNSSTHPTKKRSNIIIIHNNTTNNDKSIITQEKITPKRFTPKAPPKSTKTLQRHPPKKIKKKQEQLTCLPQLPSLPFVLRPGDATPRRPRRGHGHRGARACGERRQKTSLGASVCCFWVV